MVPIQHAGNSDTPSEGPGPLQCRSQGALCQEASCSAGLCGFIFRMSALREAAQQAPYLLRTRESVRNCLVIASQAMTLEQLPAGHPGSHVLGRARGIQMSSVSSLCPRGPCGDTGGHQGMLGAVSLGHALEAPPPSTEPCPRDKASTAGTFSSTLKLGLVCVSPSCWNP